MSSTVRSPLSPHGDTVSTIPHEFGVLPVGIRDSGRNNRST